jgi:hypothetical protein
MVSGTVSEWSHMKMCKVVGRENSWMRVAYKIAVMIRCIPMKGTYSISSGGE